MLFAGLGIELAALVLLHRAQTLGDVRAAVSPMTIVGPLMISGVVVLLAAGIWLVYAAGYGWQPWNMVSLALTVLVAIVGATINGSRGEAIVAMVKDRADGPIPASVDAARYDPVWNYAILFSVCQLLVLIYLMSAKPSLAMSLAAIVIGALVAFVPSAVLLRRAKMRQAETA